MKVAQATCCQILANQVSVFPVLSDSRQSGISISCGRRSVTQIRCDTCHSLLSLQCYFIMGSFCCKFYLSQNPVKEAHISSKHGCVVPGLKLKPGGYITC